MQIIKQYQLITLALVLFCINGFSQRYSSLSREVEIGRSNEIAKRSYHVKSGYQHVNRTLKPKAQSIENYSKGEIDTLNFPLAGTYNFYISDEGYASGNNEYGDKAKANIFNINEPKLITGILIDFAHATGNSNITIGVWNNSGANGSPGSQIGSSVISTSEIIDDIENEVTTFVEFIEPVFVTGNFYAGVKLPTIAGDTVVIFTNTDGDTSPPTAWEQWEDNSWVRYDGENSWNLFVAHAIFPIVDNEIGLQADFDANATVIEPGQSIDFTDNSFGNPTSWEWTFEGGNPETSTEQNPVVFYAEVGTFDVSLKINDGVNSDSITKADHIVVSQALEPQIDTLNFPLPGNYGLFVYESPASGYITGTNSYNDLAKANFFSNNTELKITGILFDFAIAEGNSNNIEFVIWNNNGTGNKPGTELGSKTKSYSSIINDVNNQQLSYVEFNPPVIVNHSFYAGLKLPTGSATIALWSNTIGDTNPGIAWELWDTNEWFAMNAPPAVQIDIAMGIHPIVDYSVGINDNLANKEIKIFPNPTAGLINIETSTLNSNAEIKIYNTAGILVYETFVNSNTQDSKIDLSKQENGIYIIRIESDREIFVDKIIKN